MYDTFGISFVKIECCNCGVFFAITADLERNLRKTKNSFYCPNGHSQSYSKSTEEVLKEKLQVKDNLISELERQVTVLSTPKKRGRKAKR